MIFSTILYFNRRSMINSTDIFNGEYTDMGFELIDNHLFIGDTDLSNKGYNQKEIYTVYLNLKYRDKDSKEFQSSKQSIYLITVTNFCFCIININFF